LTASLSSTAWAGATASARKKEPVPEPTPCKWRLNPDYNYRVECLEHGHVAAFEMPEEAAFVVRLKNSEGLAALHQEVARRADGFSVQPGLFRGDLIAEGLKNFAAKVMVLINERTIS